MPKKKEYESLNDATELAQFQFCSVSVYEDLIALQEKRLTEEQFNQKYLYETAILCLNMNGLTQTGLKCGSLFCLLQIMDMQQIVAPVITRLKYTHARAFADDFVALFDDPGRALQSAFEIQERIRIFNQQSRTGQTKIYCGIGIGCGRVYRVGLDKAMGDEMNQASKLGEDIAKRNETLLTERAYAALKDQKDCNFIKRMDKDTPFVFYEVIHKHHL